MKILLIEDDASDVATVQEIIGGDHQWSVVDTASKAIDQIRKERFDYVIVDYYVPGAVEDSLVRTLSSLGYSGKMTVMTGSRDRPPFLPKSPLGYEMLVKHLADAASPRNPRREQLGGM